jgi:uncharacterized cofD-like protein
MPAKEKRLKKIVTIGGGTGHFALLSGLKKHNVDITAIVTMSDDGGSTGILRDELGVLPPGDLRQCLVALSEGDEVVRALFTHRFDQGSLKGHNFGNIFISALEHVSGSIDRAVDEVGKILKIKGHVLPVTLQKTKLVITLNNGKVLKGESAIGEYLLLSKFGIKEARLAPEATLNPEARKAIQEADLIVLGPGNLYSSLVPNLLVKGLPQALRRAKAKKVFVVNLMNKHGHTDDFNCVRYVEELERHAGTKFIDAVLYNNVPIPDALVKRYVDEGVPVRYVPAVHKSGPTYIGKPLFSSVLAVHKKGDPLRRTLIRHDPGKLARAIVGLL